MYEPHRRTGLVLILLACGHPLAAQFRTPSPANLARLERMWREAAAASAVVDSVARARLAVTLDTVRVESLAILAPPQLTEEATIAARAAWPALLATLGDRLREHPLRLALYLAGEPPPPGFPTDAILVPVPPEGMEPSLLAAQIRIVVQRSRVNEFDDELKSWINTGIGAPTDSVSSALFEDLVTSSAPVARSCLVGSIPACRTALVLDRPDDPSTEWYDAAGRRDLVRRTERRLARNQADYDQCTMLKVDAACLRELRSGNPGALPPPLIMDSRELLARLALGLGGSGAYNRLIASASKPIATRLVIVAHVPLDSLLTRWRSAVLSSRPQSVDLTPSTGWIALAWGVVFAVLMLGSSRWRA